AVHVYRPQDPAMASSHHPFASGNFLIYCAAAGAACAARAMPPATGEAATEPSVTRFSSLIPAISKLSTISLVLDCKTEWSSNKGMAEIKPKAVVFIATEILWDSSVAFSA